MTTLRPNSQSVNKTSDSQPVSLLWKEGLGLGWASPGPRQVLGPLHGHNGRWQSTKKIDGLQFTVDSVVCKTTTTVLVRLSESEDARLVGRCFANVHSETHLVLQTGNLNQTSSLQVWPDRKRTLVHRCPKSICAAFVSRSCGRTCSRRIGIRYKNSECGSVRVARRCW